MAAEQSGREVTIDKLKPQEKAAIVTLKVEIT